MAKKYLSIHKKALATGKLPDVGLCCTIPDSSDDENFKLFSTFDTLSGEQVERGGYWAYDGEHSSLNDFPTGTNYNTIRFKYTELRQNIILFLAAMNGEL